MHKHVVRVNCISFQACVFGVEFSGIWLAHRSLGNTSKENRDGVVDTTESLNLLVPGSSWFVIITPDPLRPRTCAIAAYLMGRIQRDVSIEHHTSASRGFDLVGLGWISLNGIISLLKDNPPR